MLSTVLFGMLLAGVALQAVAAETTDPAQETLLQLFPESTAPTTFEKQSETVLLKDLSWWERVKNWHPELDEQSVFHAAIQHRSVTERSWELGIGKGGQIYSMYSTFGEAMAPSQPESQWNDEVWQFTTIYERLLGRDLPDSPGDATRMKYANAFVHQSGVYTKEKGSKPFYSPILAEYFDEEERSYSILSWGQIPSPSINRSGILVYTKYRDLGAGVIEMTYVIYNFEDEPMTNLGPWGGVRTSVFPEHVISNPDGSYRYFTPWSYGYDRLEGCRINFEDTGGWAAVTANADDPHSHAIGVVFGKQLDKKGDHYNKPRYDCGDSRHGKRDYTVQATVIHIKDKPGTPHMLRMYFAIGTLAKVAKQCNRLAGHADYEPLTFTETNTPLVPLYAKSIPVSVAKSVSVSSEYSKAYRAELAVDGLLNPEGEWSSRNEQTPWIRVDFGKEIRVERVVLYDKANPVDNARGGMLRFSDGTSMKVTGIPVDGSPHVVEFPAKDVTWVKFNISEGEGSNVGLTEIQVVSDAAGRRTFLTRKPSGQPVCSVYAWPVNGSVPLFLMRNNETKRNFVTTDPYAQCASEPFKNPFKPGHESYEKYQNRTIYRPYLQKSTWVELLGFVMSKDKANTKAASYTPLSTVGAVQHSFDPGEKHDAGSVLVRKW